MEDVFLAHLEMEFPEFKRISASVRGELRRCVEKYLLSVHNRVYQPASDSTDKQKKSSAELCGAVISMNYKKVRSVNISLSDTYRGSVSVGKMFHHLPEETLR